MQLFNKNLILINFPTLFLILLPGFLISGPFLSDLSVSIIALFFLIYCITENNYKYFNNYFFKFSIIFYLWILTCSLVSENIFFSISTSLFYIRFSIFSIAVYFLIDSDKKLKKNIFFSLLFFFSILSLDAYFQYFNSFNIFGWPLHEDGRVSSFFKDELVLGSYFSRLLPLFFCLLLLNLDFLKKKIHLYYMSLIVFFSAVISVYISAERSSVFLFFLSFTFLFITLSKNKNIILIAIILMISMFFFSYFKQDKTYKRLLGHTVHQFTSLERKNSSNIFDYIPSTHKNLYLNAYNIFNENKFFGTGPKTFRIESQKDKYNNSLKTFNTHPHNTYLQLLSETGFIGFSFIFIIFLVFVYNSIRHLFFKYSNKILLTDAELCLFSMVIITLWPLIPTGNFFGNWINIFYYLPVGFILQYSNKKKKQ
jgi:O-antigen ligase